MSILKTALFSFAVAASMAAPLSASAQSPAVTAPHRVDVRAGPDGVYPVVAVLPPRAEVEVYGCLQGYSWCDVGFGMDRGWIHSQNLRYYYQNRYVPFAGVATIVGIGLTGFYFDDYWRNHYRSRNFYSDRDRWHRGPAPRYWNGPDHRPGFGNDHRPGFGPGNRPGNGADYRPNFAPNNDQNRGNGVRPNRDNSRDNGNNRDNGNRDNGNRDNRVNDGSSGWAPGMNGQPVRPVQPAQPQGQPQTQLAPGRPHGGQPGMQAPQAVTQPAAPIAAQPQQRGGPPQGNAGNAQQQGGRGEGHGGGRRGGDDDKKN